MLPKNKSSSKHGAKCYSNQHLNSDMYTSRHVIDLTLPELSDFETILGCVQRSTHGFPSTRLLLPPIPSESDRHFLFFSMGATWWIIKEKNRQFATADSSFESVASPHAHHSVFSTLARVSKPRTIRVGYLHAHLAQTKTKTATAIGKRAINIGACGRLNVAWARGSPWITQGLQPASVISQIGPGWGGLMCINTFTSYIYGN
jgi:hypothetical protein